MDLPRRGRAAKELSHQVRPATIPIPKVICAQRLSGPPKRWETKPGHFLAQGAHSTRSHDVWGTCSVWVPNDLRKPRPEGSRAPCVPATSTGQQTRPLPGLCTAAASPSASDTSGTSAACLSRFSIAYISRVTPSQLIQEN